MCKCLSALFIVMFMVLSAPSYAQNLQVVTTCGTLSLSPGMSAAGSQDVTGKACQNGTTVVTPTTVTPVTASSALESNHVLKNAAGAFFGVQVNTTSAAEYVMLFNATSLPSNGAVTPEAVWQVPANSTLSISENPGLSFATGIVVGCSTTGPLTLTASALCMFGAGAVQ